VRGARFMEIHMRAILLTCTLLLTKAAFDRRNDPDVIRPAPASVRLPAKQ